VKLTSTSITGGRSDQVKELLRSPSDFVFANPGRLYSYVVRSKNLPREYFKNVFVAVLDEADTLLDLGFLEYVKALLDVLPIAKQTVYYSATFPKNFDNLVERRKTGGVGLRVLKAFDEKKEVAVVSTLENHYVVSSTKDFHSTLLGILKVYEGKKNSDVCVYQESGHLIH